MAKTDIELAFRLFPVHPEDWELLGMQWEGLYYYDKVLPFGLRSAPFLFNQLSIAVEWILSEKCAMSYVTHFLNDFLIIEPPNKTGSPSAACESSLRSMLLVFNALSIPISPGKTEGPSTCLEFLGIVLDSLGMEARLPLEKVQRIKEELALWKGKKSATLVELQSLIGTLNFACRVIPPGRAFLQRIINLTVGLKKPHHRVRLTKAFFQDIAMWEVFIFSWNGRSFFLNRSWETSSSLHLFKDASGSLGFGGFTGISGFRESGFRISLSPQRESQLHGRNFMLLRLRAQFGARLGLGSAYFFTVTILPWFYCEHKEVKVWTSDVTRSQADFTHFTV